MNLETRTWFQRRRAAQLVRSDDRTVVFASPLLRAREIKMAAALRKAGWKVVLLYLRTTPFAPQDYFDVAICMRSEVQLHAFAKELRPRISHVFSGAVDELVLRFCADKPGPVVVDLNDIFCPSLFNYCQERFEPTRASLAEADGLCARDLQAKFAERLDGYRRPPTILFAEYGWGNRSTEQDARLEPRDNEIRVASVGTFTLETQGMYDSSHLKLAQLLAEQKIHLHIFPHWFYLKRSGSAFNRDLEKDFVDFFDLQDRTPYLHVHECLPLDDLARELPRYDFGIISGACPAFGQRLQHLTENYMQSCFSGRIADYLDARLPVLINREVGFNYRLLRHYGVAVDLEGVLRPGFRDELLAIKQDPACAARVEAAAQTLSLDRNVGRLTAFYDRIVSGSCTVRSLPEAEFEAAIETLGRRPSARVSSASNSEINAIPQPRWPVVRRRNYLKLQTRLRNLVEETNVLRSEISALRHEIKRGNVSVDEISGLLNWPQIFDRIERTNGFSDLIETTRLFAAGSGELNGYSAAWQVLSEKNFNQLLIDGYRNFKRTIACNYFNFLVQNGDSQLAFLEREMDQPEIERCRALAKALPDDHDLNLSDQATYRYFVLLLWKYVSKIDVQGYRNRLEDPAEGNPLVYPLDGRLVSSDLANSLLEYYSIREAVDMTECGRVLEIGGGYGRNAYVMLKLHPGVQYTMVDIPPGLFVAQRYLSSIFRDLKVFPVQEFANYEDVRQEMENASIVFLLPNQLKLLPNNNFNLVINISSFGEMNVEQINIYFKAIDRKVGGYFFNKQWKTSPNPFDGLNLEEADYPVDENWEKIYSRDCRVQTNFFEALYKIPGDTR